ncbi:MAG: helix-turn-helix domain-containing protein [Lentisphaeria bacterium]|nr:helix-turn-helix domain-containing protein [Lentisphaeria bacterium]
MSRYHDWYYPPYVSVAQKKQRNARMAQDLDDQDLEPVRVAGRVIAKTFWGKAWCQNVESYHDYINRLPRGRSYLRCGSVIDLKIALGKVTALVTGSRPRPYEITIDIKPLAPERWEALKKKCVGRISSLMSLIQGRLPPEILSEFCSQSQGLFPAPREMTMTCSCPDIAGLCKHLAAVLYGIGARLDENPKLFFTLRGLDENELIGGDMVDSLTAGTSSEIGTDDLAGVFGVEFDDLPDIKPSAGADAASGAAAVVDAPVSAPREWTPAALRAMRKSIMMTQAELGRLLGVSAALVSALEGGRAKLSPSARAALEKIAPSAAPPARASAASLAPAAPPAPAAPAPSRWTPAAMRELRSRLNMSQSKLAWHFLTNQMKVSLMERGFANITPFHREVLDKLAKTLESPSSPSPSWSAPVSTVSDVSQAVSRLGVQKNPWTAKGILELRQRLGLSQVRFGQKLQVSATTVCLLEKGRVTISRAVTEGLDRLAAEASRGAEASPPPAVVSRSRRSKAVPAKTKVKSWTPLAIARLRQRLGLSLNAFAKKVGSCTQTIRNWENGKSFPGPAAKARLSALDK